MTDIQEPLPEEHAYHLGWSSYFDIGEGAENPYDEKTDKSLFDRWVRGQETAKSVDKTLQGT